MPYIRTTMKSICLLFVFLSVSVSSDSDSQTYSCSQDCSETEKHILTVKLDPVKVELMYFPVLTVNDNIRGIQVIDKES